MTRRIRSAAGFSLILLRAIGTLVPVVPGLPMILAGVALVGTDHPWIRSISGHLKSRPGGRRQRVPARPDFPTPATSSRSELTRD
jgi:hypothetical protein